MRKKTSIGIRLNPDISAPTHKKISTGKAEDKLGIRASDTCELYFDNVKVPLENRIGKFTVDSIPKELLYEAKQKGYADRQLGHLLSCLESEVFNKRHDLGIKRVYKLVDTCAAEFEAVTPYFYSTFEDKNESIVSVSIDTLFCLILSKKSPSGAKHNLCSQGL